MVGCCCCGCGQCQCGCAFFRWLLVSAGSREHVVNEPCCERFPQIVVGDCLIMRLCYHSTRFILIGIQHNENVGAAARAIKTMGFDDLALVSPRDIKVLGRRKVIQMSSGATDVLRNAKIYKTLHEAIGDSSVVCGTRMPNFELYRDKKSPRDMMGVQHFEPRVYFDELLQARCLQNSNIDCNDYADHEREDSQALRLALIFGSEQTGKENYCYCYSLQLHSDSDTSCCTLLYQRNHAGMSESDMAQCHIMLGIPTNQNFGSLNVAAAVQLIAYDWRMAIGWDA